MAIPATTRSRSPRTLTRGRPHRATRDEDDEWPTKTMGSLVDYVNSVTHRYGRRPSGAMCAWYPCENTIDHFIPIKVNHR